MDFPYASQASSFSVPSPDGRLIATLVLPRLILRSAESLRTVRTIELGPEFGSRVSCVKWSPFAPAESSTDGDIFDHEDIPQRSATGQSALGTGSGTLRLLLADHDTIRVWDVDDAEWTATISGAGGGVGKIASVEFGSDADELLVFSEHAVKVIVWSLLRGTSVEIRDPKFASAGHGYRPRSKHFALLTRVAARDVVTIHARQSYKLLASLGLPTTDAQGLKWSPCGRWIIMWDSASSGYKAHVCTADGHLFRTYAGPQENDVVGLGIKTVEWSPRGEYAATGDHAGRVTLLSNSTFSPAMLLEHTATINLPKVPAWQETLSSTGQREYVLAAQPMCPPMANFPATDPRAKIGISTIAFDRPDGTLVASRWDAMPTAVWIWSLTSLSPCAILVHHAHVKSVQWHPTQADLLLLQCANEEPVVYLWRSTWAAPRVEVMPLQRPWSKVEARWIHPVSASSAETLKIMVGNAKECNVGYVNNGLGSLVGAPEHVHRSSADLQGQRRAFSESGFGARDSQILETMGLDDTFQYCKQVAFPL
ncbi:MAG: hypothetical protein M1832_004371 [Thelocarpon impressellum]|nr:MAG: hypothetical protein M1832_004371 [Thelocarpon impressellum]